LKKLALISVSDKSKIVELAKSLTEHGYEIIATGNTAKALSSSGIKVLSISSVTGSPEIFDGRVKTLHPKIFGGILLRRDNGNDLKEAEANNIKPIDLVCVNLYSFIKTAENPDSDLNTIIENIDIGGPSLIRASAKNYKCVSVLTNPEQYDPFIDELNKGNISIETRERLATQAFAHTAFYDAHIADFFENKFPGSSDTLRLFYKKEKSLRYGENPHQNASIYGNFYSYFNIFHGKELSYNNILDLISAVQLVEELGNNSCSIIKHNNPAGAATAGSCLEAYTKALKCDPVSAYGGIVSFSSPIDEEIAQKLNEIFLEVVSAPGFTEEAVKILMKRKDRRLLKQLKSIRDNKVSFRNIPGGVIVQEPDNVTLSKDSLKVVTEKKPSQEELKDLYFAWTVAKEVKSNAIVFAKDEATLGVGAGQMSRIDSVKIASIKAKQNGLDLIGSVAASDAFFPFPDALTEIINCGATAVIQPGGSIRDNEVIKTANERGVAMVFTGIRHFKH
jgi:phosphoribosylaminoimidazolecarboxamide formyltransferase/IMP cyclohydrolase